MGGFFSNIIFLNPWILAALGGLPILWFLLRITPPAPRLVSLPTTRFLIGLMPESQTPERTPWWILLLRMIILALVIIALAHPVHNPASQLPGSGAVRLVIDNGWAAAQTWPDQIRAAEETLNQAAREDRPVYVMTTAPQPGSDAPQIAGPLAHAEAAALIKGMKPFPWPSDYKAAAKNITEKTTGSELESFWFSDGLDEGGFSELAEALLQQGGLFYITPKPEKLPLLLRQPEKSEYGLEIAVDAPRAIAPSLPVHVQALGEDGRVIDMQTQVIDVKNLPLNIKFDAPDFLARDVSKFRISTKAGVGGLFVLDDRFRKKSVGILSANENTESKPLIEAGYYLKRALEPYALLKMGSIDDLLSQELSVIILPDVGAMPANALNALEKWVRSGGLLLRFAGPNMTNQQDHNFLVPTTLRSGLRSTDGSLTWENSPRLKSFSESGPLLGIPVPEDITVRQQILPEPAPDLEDKTWAQLDDGTPLITAAPLDQGMLVMIHTTASPDWSNLALSGTYVTLLKRIVSLAGKSLTAPNESGGTLQPLWVFDGMGTVIKPDSSVKPVPASEFTNMPATSSHPPGLYGRGSFQQILNIGDHIEDLKIPTDIPPAVLQKYYGAKFEKDLMPYILYAAMALLLFDWLIMIIMITELRILARFSGAVLIVLFLSPMPVRAADKDVQYAGALYLAYIRTGDVGIDSQSQQGLENLASMLKRRTSAEPEGVASLDPETDTLIFFPLIYWPISSAQPPLSDKALENIQNYLDQGGTILFDTRDQNSAPGTMTGTRNMNILSQMIGGLNIPPLAPMAKNHVLNKSFYLLSSIPGRYTGETLWVETSSITERDGVSSVIIGSNDWAGAWANASDRRANEAGRARQEEMAFRFGINLLMYALTGNYKADQVHIPYILERLGQ